MTITNKTTLQKNQKGLVSIVVTLIIMLVLSLIVVGFAQLARREQREALDRQLSNQAAYAAESGINYARTQLETNPTWTAESFEKNSCPTTGSTVDTSGVIQFSCLLVTKKLSNLKYGNIQTEKSTVVPIIVPSSGPNPLSITISWQGKDGIRGIPTTTFPSFPTPAAWGTPNIGVLRLQFFNADVLNTTALDNSSFTVFGYPRLSGAGNVDYDITQQGQVIEANCSSPTSPKRCSITISNLPAGRLFLRMKSFYTASDVEICANTCDGTDKFSNAQIEIDSTGKANDVLRRTVVRVEDKSLYSSSVYKPEFTLDSADSICKLYDLVPTVPPNPSASIEAAGCP